MRRGLVLLALVAVACGPSAERSAVFLDDVATPVTLVPTAARTLLYAELAAGRVIEVDLSGRPAASPVAELDVATQGQRGLLGVAVDEISRVYASWVEPGGRLVVGRVAPSPVEIIWEGPTTADRGNGGRLALWLDGRILIGIGDLENPEAVDDPATPNGKLLLLDPDGAPAQTPEVLSSGWNNPFAFTITPLGELWVADNAPGSAAERLARADLDGRPTSVLELGTGSVPSGLAAIGPRDLLLCSRGTGLLQRYRIGEAGAEPTGEPLADDCTLDVAVLPNGDIVYSTESQIRYAG